MSSTWSTCHVCGCVDLLRTVVARHAAKRTSKLLFLLRVGCVRLWGWFDISQSADRRSTKHQTWLPPCSTMKAFCLLDHFVCLITKNFLGEALSLFAKQCRHSLNSLIISQMWNVTLQGPDQTSHHCFLFPTCWNTWLTDFHCPLCKFYKFYIHNYCKLVLCMYLYRLSVRTLSVRMIKDYMHSGGKWR